MFYNLNKVLLAFYLLIASQHTNLMGKQLTNYIENNRMAQHVIAFTLLLVLINIVGEVQEIELMILYTSICYLWFIFSTKLDIQWNVLILLLLLLGYFYESKSNYSISGLFNDQVLTVNDKSQNIQKHKLTRSVIALGLITITLMGTFLYANNNENQNGGGLNPNNPSIVNFLFYES
jgi:hypothetical protein